VLQGLKVRGLGEASVVKDSVSVVKWVRSKKTFHFFLSETSFQKFSFLASFAMFDPEAH
jgi:hypothetical protein